MEDNITSDQLRLIYDHTTDLIFLLDVIDEDVYEVVSVNQQYLKQSGLSASDLMGRRLSDIYSGEDLKYLLRQYRKAIRSGGPYRYETSAALMGSTIHIDTMLVPVFDPEGKCKTLIGVSRDISSKHIEQRELREAKLRAENYLDISEALIVGLDTDCNITMLNRKGYEMLGYPEGSLIGQNWCELAIRPERREAYMEGFRNFLEEGSAGSHVLYLVTASGENLLISSQSGVVHDDNGKVVGILSSGEDITDRVHAERAMISSQRSLAAQEVINGVAHDFNNSLQGIVGNLEIALMQPGLSEETLRSLRAASNLADDAASQIRMLRQTAATGNQEESSAVPVNEVIEEAVEESRYLWKGLPERDGRSIELHLNLQDPGGYCEGTRKGLRSVLYNLIKNAVEAIRASGKVSITATREADQVRIRVQDNGVGMDTDTAARVFQPFFSTKGMETGRGLGMAAAHSIVRAHGGDISIAETTPGVGTTFEIRLPLIESPGAEAAQVPAPDASFTHHVLWVDDDPFVRDIAVQFLELCEVTGEVAESGADALNLFPNHQFSLVITDIGMKGMSGVELAAELQQLDSNVPIVAVSGWGESALQSSDGEHHFKAVLGKPIRLDDLRDLLTAYPPRANASAAG